MNINRKQPERKLLERARDVLAEGGLLIVPTETVYGLACDPTAPNAMEKLIAAKGRDGDKPIARLAADMQQVIATAVDWSRGLEAIALTYWPGPLTIVLETVEGWTGFRVPDHAVAAGLARVCEHTLALTSANRSGEPDTKTAQDAANAVKVDLVLDSGPSAVTAVPSTVIKVDGDQIECLREGCLPFAEIRQTFQSAWHR